jgi:PadR family transcriptional regulator
MAAASAASASIAKWEVQLRKGCLELAILASLWSGELYGLEILRRLADGSNIVVPEGTVYPLLSRLKADGWVDAQWVSTDTGHPRKYYRLTRAGRRHVAGMARAWADFAESLDHLLAPVREEAR